MSKIYFAILTGLATTAAASAGQIQVGGASGLTSAYIGSANIGTGWAQKAYSSTLFQNAMVTPNAGQPSLSTATTLTDAGGVQFDETPGFLWASPGSGALTSLIIPINDYNVTGVDILLNDYAGFAGSNPTISFNFTGGVDTIAIPDLANGTGAIRSAVNCTAVTGSAPTFACSPGSSNPPTIPGGHTVSSSGPSSGAITTHIANGDQIVTSAIWTGTYSIAQTSANTDYFYNSTTGSSGNVMLDELAFSFGPGNNLGTLQSITLTESGTAGPGSSRLALSAITVIGDTPEPSSVLLFATAISLLGFARLRLRQQ